MQILSHVRLSRGEGETVDRRISIVDGAQCIVKRDSAAVIKGLADAKDRSPVACRLFAQQVHSKTKTIENGRSPIAWLQVCHCSGNVVQVGSEICLDVWLTVKSDDGHTVRNGTYHGIEEWIKAAVVIQPAAARPASLHDDHQGQRPTVGVFFQCDILLDAIIGKDEIFRSETENRFAAAGLYQRRYQD
jgi:hypothetical protein